MISKNRQESEGKPSGEKAMAMEEKPLHIYEDLKGKVAFVTGAAGRIGLATSLALARSGVTVGMVDIKEEPLVEACQKVEAIGGRAIPLTADVTDAARMTACAQTLVETFESIDIVFANAGNNCKWRYIEDFEPGEWENTIRLNLMGAYHTISPAIPIMKEHGGGSVAVTSSINGTTYFGNKGASAYCAAKAGLVAMVKSLAVELAEHRIRVNSVCPGSIQSQQNWNRYMDDVREGKRERRKPHNPIPLTADSQPGTPEDVASLVCFLASNASKHMTGATITLDGAQSIS